MATVALTDGQKSMYGQGGQHSLPCRPAGALAPPAGGVAHSEALALARLSGCVMLTVGWVFRMSAITDPRYTFSGGMPENGVNGMATSFEQRTENDVNGLREIAKFGWIRSAELSLFIFYGKWRRTQMDRLVRSWVKRNLVIERPLPEGAGRAIVLATAGVRLLAEHGYSEKSGKNEGNMANGVWQPPFAWKHHLMAHGVLGHLHVLGYDVTTEHQIKALGEKGKRPDGVLYCQSDKRWSWLEVENAKKDGHHMEELAQAVYKVSTIGQVVDGNACKGAVIAFNPKAKDTRGHNLNHEERVRAAISKIAEEPITVTWCQCRMEGLGVAAIELSTEKISPDYGKQVRAALDKWGWREQEDGLLLSEYKGHQVRIGEADGDVWGCLLDQENQVCACTDTEEEIKQAAVLEILERGW